VLAVAVRQTLELSELLLLYVANYRIGSLEGNLAMTRKITMKIRKDEYYS